MLNILWIKFFLQFNLNNFYFNYLELIVEYILVYIIIFPFLDYNKLAIAY
jgi:hypothetical protein